METGTEAWMAGAVFHVGAEVEHEQSYTLKHMQIGQWMPLIPQLFFLLNLHKT